MQKNYRAKGRKFWGALKKAPKIVFSKTFLKKKFKTFTKHFISKFRIFFLVPRGSPHRSEGGGGSQPPLPFPVQTQRSLNCLIPRTGGRGSNPKVEKCGAGWIPIHTRFQVQISTGSELQQDAVNDGNVGNQKCGKPEMWYPKNTCTDQSQVTPGKHI